MTTDLWRKPTSWIEPSDAERDEVARLLEKEPRGEFQIVARGKAGEPLVIENAPFFRDGTPMPTRFWLIDPTLCRDVAHIESSGGVKKADNTFTREVIYELHARYARERDAFIPNDADGPRPSGGVGGTRRGVKCLHTHVAHFLATGDDVIGQWTIDEIARMKARV